MKIRLPYKQLEWVSKLAPDEALRRIKASTGNLDEISPPFSWACFMSPKFYSQVTENHFILKKYRNFGHGDASFMTTLGAITPSNQGSDIKVKMQPDKLCVGFLLLITVFIMGIMFKEVLFPSYYMDLKNKLIGVVGLTILMSIPYLSMWIGFMIDVSSTKDFLNSYLDAQELTPEFYFLKEAQ